MPDKLSHMHEEVAVYKNKRRRKKLFFLLLIPFSMAGIWLGNGKLTNFLSSQSTYHVTLGQVSFEQIEERLDQSPHFLMVFSPKGKVIDTIYSLKEYQKLFFEEGNLEEIGTLTSYNSQEVSQEGLDPLVDLGDVSNHATQAVLEEPIEVKEVTQSPERLVREDFVAPEDPRENTQIVEISVTEPSEKTPQDTRGVSSVSNVKDLVSDLEPKHKMTNSSLNALPEFPGGMNMLTQYLKKHTQYPKEAALNQIKGVVYVSFLVDENGDINSPKVIRGLGYGCDEEVLRLLSKMPHWKAARYRGEAIEMSYTLSVPFPPQ